MQEKKTQGGGCRCGRKRGSGSWLQGAAAFVFAILLADAVSGMPYVEEWAIWLG